VAQGVPRVWAGWARKMKRKSQDEQVDWS
jgi:hypothetical protein